MEKYMGVAELMKTLGIGRSTAYELIKFPGFPAARIGKRVVISESALREWINNGGTAHQGAR